MWSHIQNDLTRLLLTIRYIQAIENNMAVEASLLAGDADWSLKKQNNLSTLPEWRRYDFNILLGFFHFFSICNAATNFFVCQIFALQETAYVWLSVRSTRSNGI